FMANALGCAAANASLDLFASEPRLAQVATIEALLRTGLEPCRKLAGVKQVRVQGAIGVVELDRIENINHLRQRFIEERVFVRPRRLPDAGFHQCRGGLSQANERGRPRSRLAAVPSCPDFSNPRPRHADHKHRCARSAPWQSLRSALGGDW